MPINLRALFYRPSASCCRRRCLSAVYRRANGVNALKGQLSRICFEALNGLRSSYFWRKSARSKAKRPRPSKTESNPYIPAHTWPSSERYPTRPSMRIVAPAGGVRRQVLYYFLSFFTLDGEAVCRCTTLPTSYVARRCTTTYASYVVLPYLNM